MSLKCMLGIAIAWIMVTQTLGEDFYLNPNASSSLVYICGSKYCPRQSPCGVPDVLMIATPCSVYIGTGIWTKTLVIRATGVSPVIYSWNSTGDYIRNFKLNLTGDASTQLRLESWNAIGTTLNVSCNVLEILDSTFILDNVEPFTIFGFGTTPRLDIQGTSLIKTAGQSSTISLGAEHEFDIMIVDSNITMANFGIFSGPVSGITVQRSSLNAYALVTQALSNMLIADSHLVGFQASLAADPPGSFSSTKSTFTGLSESEIFPLFQTTSTMGSFTVSDCIFRLVQFSSPSQTASTVEAIRNTFHDFRFSFDLVSPNTATPFSFINNTFLRYTSSYPALELTHTPNYASIHLSGNRFENRFTLGTTVYTCGVSLRNLLVNSASNLVTDGLCVGSTQFDGYLEARFIDVAIGGLGILNTTGETTLSSFKSDTTIAFSKNHLSYSITNASQGIDTYVEEMPRSLHLSWQDTNHHLAVGDSWPVFTKADPSAVFPTTLSTDGSFTFSLSSACTAVPSTCMVNFTILSISCPCNPQHSEPCGNPFVYPCTCIAPWTGPTCDINSSSPPTSNPTSNPISQSCPTPQPSLEFECQNGTWTSNTSVYQDVFSVPPNLGTIVVNGNLTVNQTVIFQGLGTIVNITGCLLAGSIQIVKEKGQVTPSQDLISTGEDCPDISGTLINVITTGDVKKCEKETARLSKSETNGRVVYSAIFVVNDKDCKHSNRWWIILVSVLGGVVLIVIVAMLLVTFVKPIRVKVRPFWARNHGSKN